MRNEQITIQTKNKMADALKEIMKHKDFNKISIKDITEACDISRPTFYYHFQDIYELLEYTFNKELVSIFDSSENKDIKERLSTVLAFVLDHKEICLSAYHNIGYEKLEHYLFPYTKKIMKSVIEEINQNIGASKEDTEFILRYHTHGFVGLLIDYLEGYQMDCDEFVHRFDLIMDGAIETELKRCVLDKRADL